MFPQFILIGKIDGNFKATIHFFLIYKYDKVCEYVCNNANKQYCESVMHPTIAYFIFIISALTCNINFELQNC